MLQIALIFTFLMAEPPLPKDPQQQAWEKWQEKTFSKALNSPKSFLNAFALEQAPAGESLFLVLGKLKKDTRWQKQRPKDFYAFAEHLGSKIRIQVKEATLGYVKNEHKMRRQDFVLPNGAVAEVVYGKRNQKMWAYLYDPEQVQKFSGFRFFEYNPKAIVTGLFKKQKPQFISYKTVQGDLTQVNHVGNVSFAINGKDYYLPAYNWQPPNETMNYIALIFTDETKGVETYAGGRELVIDMPNGLHDGAKVNVNFNKTMNFFCAHSPFWHCPVGLQKHLDTKINAGEKLPERKIR